MALNTKFANLLSLYANIPSSERRLLSDKIQQREFRRGDYLLLDDEVQKELLFITAGVVYTYLDRDKTIQVVDFAYQNRIAADLKSFSQQNTASYCIECLTDGAMEKISYDDLFSVFDKSPATERAYRILLEHISASLLERALNNGALSIAQRFEWVMNRRPELFKLAPHKLIASYINVDTTNFSKLYNEYCIRNGLFYK